MRTLIFTIAMLVIGACAGSEDVAPTVDEAEGIRAESRAGNDCGDACIITTLSDAVTNVPLATVVWNADTAIGTLTEARRTTTITAEELEVMTTAEANRAARTAWLALAARGEPEVSSATGTSAAGATCTTVETNDGSCTCVSRVCMACQPTETGEYCSVTFVHYCYGNRPMYVGRCG